MTTTEKEKLLKIFMDGVLVDVDVSCWTGAKLLTPEDLGLEAKDVAEAYKLGKKMLVPDRVIAAFRKIESQARVIVDNNSFRFPFGSARFVPKRRFPAILEKLEEYQDQYYRLVDLLVEHYDEYRQEMIPVYTEAAETAFINQTPEQSTFGPDYDREAEKRAFVDKFLARIATFYPPIETIKTKFSLGWSVYEISIPRLNEGDAGQISLDEQEREAIARDYQAQMHTKISSFVDDVVKVMRDDTIKTCNHIAESIQTGKVIRSSTLQSLRSFIDKFSSLNFVGDNQIEEALASVRKELLDAHPDLAENEDLKDQLKARLGEIAMAAQNITDVNQVTGAYRRKISYTPKE
jgi:Protein of unknown function (DUF3150)